MKFRISLPALIIPVLFFACIFPVFSQENNHSQDKMPYQITRASSVIKVDGVLDEEAWDNVWSMELKYEVRPGENIPPPVQTEVLITYNDKNVYFAFRAYDPHPKEIRAHLSDHDNIGNDDWVAMILDTFNDERRSFGFMVNPLGVQTDFVETESGDGGEWDAIWESAGKIFHWGYSVEMRIPFSSLRFQRASGDQIWGIDAIRRYPRKHRYHIGLFPRDRNNNCYLCQAIKIKGFEGVSPGRNLEITPTLTGVKTDEREDFPEGGFINRDKSLEAGVTARWGVTPNMTVATTINPDFSQVEADARQLDINEPFALFYSEKRPFFMEGSDYFSTTLNAVYTRTMREPIWGLKLTGKERGNTIGCYVVRDELTNLIFPGNQESRATSLDMPSTSSVFRFKRDIGSKYTLGALVTDREGDSYFNRVAGFDGDFRFTSKDNLKVQFLGSSTRYPDEVAADFDQKQGKFNDWAMDVTYIHKTRTLSYWGVFRKVGMDFRADLGFMPKVGYRGYLAGAEYTWNPGENSWYSSFELEGEYVHHQDQDGNLLDKQFTVMFTYEGEPRQSHSFIQAKRKREVYHNVVFDLNSIFFHHCMNPNGDSHIWLNVDIGHRVDYANIQLGNRVRIAPGIFYRFGRHLMVDFNHTFERMNVDAGRLFTANLSQATIAYQFNRRMFIRSIFQYVNYDYNIENYSYELDPRYEHLFTQILFSYKINPQTVFFLGYSDNYLGNQDINLTRSDRTFFMKIGYAWTL